MAKKQGIALAVAAFVVYILGGIGTFAGLGMILLMRGRDFFGLGDCSSIGYLFLCVGLSSSILGIVFMRIFKNRGLA